MLWSQRCMMSFDFLLKQNRGKTAFQKFRNEIRELAIFARRPNFDAAHDRIRKIECRLHNPEFQKNGFLSTIWAVSASRRLGGPRRRRGIARVGKRAQFRRCRADGCLPCFQKRRARRSASLQRNLRHPGTKNDAAVLNTLRMTEVATRSRGCNCRQSPLGPRFSTIRTSRARRPHRARLCRTSESRGPWHSPE